MVPEDRKDWTGSDYSCFLICCYMKECAEVLGRKTGSYRVWLIGDGSQWASKQIISTSLFYLGGNMAESHSGVGAD